MKKTAVIALSLLVLLFVGCAGGKQTEEAEKSVETAVRTAKTEFPSEWNGYPLSTEYEDWTFEYIKEETALPFEIGFSVNDESVKYSNVKTESAVEIPKEGCEGETEWVTVETYMPKTDLKSLDYRFFVKLKDGADKQSAYELFMWDGKELIFGGVITEEETEIPLKIKDRYGNSYVFALFSDKDIISVGEFGFAVEENNKLCDYYVFLDITDGNRCFEDTKADVAGYYKTAVLPGGFSASCLENPPEFRLEYRTRGEALMSEEYGEHAEIYSSFGS